MGIHTNRSAYKDSKFWICILNITCCLLFRLQPLGPWYPRRRTKPMSMFWTSRQALDLEDLLVLDPNSKPPSQLSPLRGWLLLLQLPAPLQNSWNPPTPRPHYPLYFPRRRRQSKGVLRLWVNHQKAVYPKYLKAKRKYKRKSRERSRVRRNQAPFNTNKYNFILSWIVNMEPWEQSNQVRIIYSQINQSILLKHST